MVSGLAGKQNKEGWWWRNGEGKGERGSLFKSIKYEVRHY